MIAYTDKGAGLTERVNRAGLYLREENGVMLSNDDSLVQTIVDSYSLADAKAYKANEVSLLAKSLRDKVVKAISPGEMASWPIKLAEAARFATTGLDSDAPMLTAEAKARGITTAAIAARVSGNGSGFAALEAAIGGIDGKHRDAIKALTTFDAINGYDYSTGWPGV